MAVLGPQRLQERLIKQEHDFLSHLMRFDRSLVLEPGQSFRLIVIVVPAVTLLFTEALTGLQHDGCTRTLIL